MSRLTNLIAQTRAKDPALAAALEAEYRALSTRRQFGLNFERHQPEAVELPGRPIRKGDKVRVLPPRGTTDREEFDQRLWRVTKVANVDGGRVAHLVLHDVDDPKNAETQIVNVEDVVVVAEFRDPIYPGLRSTGKVERGGDKPFHTVINAENFHALQTLLYTHRGKVDAIYIDPPYNTGAKDWKYNNDFVDGEDAYRHSKWLAFMERRLKLARQLLNPDDSVLIVTIDEKEYLRLGLLLEQTFPEGRITMVTSSINAAGATRKGTFARAAEYLYFVQFGTSRPVPLALHEEWNAVKTDNKSDIYWSRLIRSGSDSARADSANQFYPVIVRNTEEGPVIESIGDTHIGDRSTLEVPDGCVAVWPIRKDGSEGRWRVSARVLRGLRELGHVRLGGWREGRTTVYYLKQGESRKVTEGVFPVIGHRADGSVITDASDYQSKFIPTDVWRITSHDAGNSGSRLISNLIPGRSFPYPKSLYAVEDALRFFVAPKPDAVVLDFFAGSGTTAHAVMRLNREDGGRRQSISVTNNEVAAEEQDKLREDGLRPGDPDWEALGICDYVTKPRLAAAITGVTPDGQPIRSEYKFNEQGSMGDGFEENVEFFTLTYETPWRVARNRDFERIAPLLWLRAGSQGRRIDTLPDSGWDVADTYGVIAALDRDKDFQAVVAERETVKVAYIVTDDDRRFQIVAAGLPERVESVRLYESYLNNFEINTGRE